MTTILVTGGAGFIGSHLTERLLKESYNVVIVDNFNDYYDPALKYKNIERIENTAKKTKGTVKLYKGDIRDEQFMEYVFESEEIVGVVHLAATAGVRPSIEEPVYYMQVNVIGLTILLECMRKFKVKSLAFVSSSSIYGNNKKVPFTEKDRVDEPISPYAASKKAGELICYTYHSLYSMNIACMRYFTVYGPGQRPDLAINKFTRLMLNDQHIPMYGDGSTARDYTYVSDIVEGTYKALIYTMDQEKKIYDIFNLGGSNPITLRKLIDTIADGLQKIPKIDYQPMQPGDVDVTYSDYSHAKEVLGYEPKVRIEEGIKLFINWYKNIK